jgi:exopolyphosphatase/guanosine-5'-triphosphate,3'-diphosphate pyrophosphatase
VPRFAAIDVGSNALRLLVVEADGPRAIREIHTERASVRLGRDVFLEGRLAKAAISQACEALRHFREVLDLHKVDRYRAVATSAVREAENGSLLVERARREAGIELEVIEGIEEARLVRLAIVERLDLRARRALLLDLGGGSLELSLVDRGHLRASRSLPIGTVRLLEAFHSEGRAREGDEMAREYVGRQLLEVTSEIARGDFDVVLGTGGNFDTLAQLCPELPSDTGRRSERPPPPSSVRESGRPPRQADGPVIDVRAVAALLPRLAAMTPDARRAHFGLRPDRADVIVPAAEIVLGVAEQFAIDRIAAPGIGLKDGIIEELVEKHFDVWDYGGEADATLEAALRLGRRYHFDESHGILVARLATELYDQLLPLHRLGDRERLLLRTGALLHDVGDFIRYEGHHRHSHYILTNSDLVGLTPAERAVVANVARYHRKSPPDTAHANFRELDRDDRARVRVLAAILRIADALDREHVGKVTAVRAVIEEGRMRLHLTGSPERQLEVWTVGRKSELFREVFDRAVEVARP